MIDAAISFNPLIFLIIPLAFLIGSVPFGILFAKGSGVDLMSTGSKNIGATNVLRTAGKLPAVLTLLCDMFKGTLALFICNVMITHLDPGNWSPELALTIEDLWLGIAGLAAVSGHMFSVFLSFRGGKGVATGLGVMLYYSLPTAGIMLLIWVLMAVTFRYSSLAAIAAVTAMPVILALFDASTPKIIIGVLITLLIIMKHKQNIQRLISGTESKIGNKSKAGK
ncbi:glycerol-3-phosphate acyltransferase [bacterium BMS3Abin09]|nr:glycerol-3-phosphate acyltransferase [bacterium BMS3Abin09]GBE41125.1 glycerol-3-phosphate acyltransferase [bacterium BMS3Bbin09]